MAGSESAPLPQPPPPASGSLLTAGGIILGIAALYLGREFFVPFALAGLLGFALSPIVNRLRRWHVPRAPAVLISVALAFGIIGGSSYVVATQLISLANSIPAYQRTIVEKVRSIRDAGTSGGGVLDRLTSSVEGFRRELSDETSAADPTGPASGGAAASREPVPVIIESPAGSALEMVGRVFGPLVSPLVTAGVVVVFLVFVLLEKEGLRERFIKLAGAGDFQTSTEAMSEAASRVSRYLLMQLTVNVTYGLPLGVGLYIIGVPNAALWGLMAVIFRFIPYLGPVLAAVFPIGLAFAVDPGWSMLLWVIGLFVVLEVVSNNFVEPLLYRASTGLSALAIISAAIFWTTLWGPVGLMLSTPLTVCLVVIGRYVPQLRFLGVLLSSDPVLRPEEQLYQRLLSGNNESAVEVAEDYVESHSSSAFYDDVAIPALRLAEADRLRNARGGGYRRTVAEGMVAVTREVADHVAGRRPASTDLSADPVVVPRAIGSPNLCVGGKTDLDWAAAEMVALAVAERGIGSRVLPPIAISQHGIGQIDLVGVEVVCLSYLAGAPQSSARYACRRLKRRVPELKIVVCLWNRSFTPGQESDLHEQMEADAVVFSIEAAAARVDDWVALHPSDPMMPPLITSDEHERVAALRRLGLVGGDSKHFDELANKVAAALGAPIALVTVVDENYQHWPGAAGLPPKLEACRMSDRDTSICGHVVAANDLLVVEDVAKDPRFANNPFLIENGIRAYAGAPLRTSSGHVIGSLCVIDTVPRTFNDRDCAILRKIADDLMVKVERECERAEGAPFGGQSERSSDIDESVTYVKGRFQ